ncbi:hypothetical protein NQ317_010130 [Molorchus minor]|uniref:Uncharacterized protein n=1 Tax=Molorchus minor TaxID=1323400 RepID=A0ABQ9JPP7_9CUCU|nr:hypothetical protein NQ317_010130 [Molorchus minor]
MTEVLGFACDMYTFVTDDLQCAVTTFGHATEIDILPLEDSFQSCVEGGYTYRRHRTHNHSLNRCQLFRRESNPPDEAS